MPASHPIPSIPTEFDGPNMALRTVPTGFVWTWDEIETRFHKKYFPLTYRNEKEGEFLLKQRGMTVVEYENCFMELSRYAPLIVANEQMRMWWFSEGLRADIAPRFVVLASTRMPS